jgi:hypothetical protein
MKNQPPAFKGQKKSSSGATGSARHHSDAPVQGAQVVTRTLPERKLTPSQWIDGSANPAYAPRNDTAKPYVTGKIGHHQTQFDTKPDTVPGATTKDQRGGFSTKITSTKCKPLSPEKAKPYGK